MTANIQYLNKVAPQSAEVKKSIEKSIEKYKIVI